MLHQGNKLFIVLLCILLFFSCDKYKKYNTKEIADIRERVSTMSQSILGRENYFYVYQIANDSINNWIKHELEYWKYYGKTAEYQLDSVFCVNKSGNKIVFSILRYHLPKESSADGISYFYGVKIRNTWYFFEGAYMVLPREYYQVDIHTPLSCEKLKQIATSNIYRYYLKKNKNGEWEINDDFFDKVIPASNLKVGNKLKTEEEYVRFMVEVNWSSDVNATITKYHEK